MQGGQAQRRRRKGIDSGRNGKMARRPKGNAPDACRDRRKQLLDHAGLDEHAWLFIRDRYVEHVDEYAMFQLRQAARAICLFRLHAAAPADALL
ncbi:TPA: hypothetical protein RQ777_004894 [Pseudomonas aeruginosa]|uniref:hypothetical protein n=1 Tax=Gammaproteobacteria TaxID=1236 RepID=UPI0007C778E9|nr:hypothetical protein [Pseudomonas aeruginosa]